MTLWAFINEQNMVVQIISAVDLTTQQQQRFLHDYEMIFGARQIVKVDADVRVWIGGSYDATSGVFSPPPPPIIEEMVNDDAPI